jgi:hypothetical protein
VVSVCIGPSRLHGKGLFAASALPAGTRILPSTGARISHVESQRRLAHGPVYILRLNARYDIDGTPCTNTARSIHHSCAPNCSIVLPSRTIWIVAARHIPAGEELPYNSGYTCTVLSHPPCRCGAPQCGGDILDPPYWGRIAPPHRWWGSFFTHRKAEEGTPCCAPWRHVSRHRQPTVLPWRTLPAWLVARLVTSTNTDSHGTVPGGTFLTRGKLAYVLG